MRLSQRIIRLIAFFPAVYYLQTRYSHRYKRVIYILKYWGPYILLVYLIGTQFDITSVSQILVSLLCFFNIYDFFCYENDNRATRREIKPIYRHWPYDPGLRLFFISKISQGIALNGLFFWIDSELAHFTFLLSLQALIAMTFWLHNRIDNAKRVFTFCLLYLLKGGVALVPFVHDIWYSRWITYIIFTLAFNVSYLPDYINIKILQFKSDGESSINRKLTQPIIYKNLFLIATSIFYPLILWVLAYIDILTGFEFIIDRRQTSYKLKKSNDSRKMSDV